MGVRNYGIHTVSVYKPCPMVTGFATIAEHSENLTRGNWLDLVDKPADVQEVSNVAKEVRIQVGIKSGKLFGHTSILTSIFHMMMTTSPRPVT
jgi:hypothetical protein